MKPKYTPGEWSYETRKLFTDMEPQVYVYKPGYRVIADMPGPGIRTGVESLEERQANASLIAAAPDLLEAARDGLLAQEILAQIAKKIGEKAFGTRFPGKVMLARTRKAIAKAEGTEK